MKRRSVLAENGAKEVVINVNRLSERLPQPVSLLYLRPSLSQRFVAFTLEVGPDSRKVLFIKDMVQTAVCEITFDGVDSVGGFIHKFEWGPASAPHDIYLVFDKDSVRPCIVYRYSLEEERLFRPKRFRALNITVRRMQLIMEESDLSCFVDVYRTKDDVYMIINSNNKNSSEAAVVTPKQLHCPKLVFSPRERGLQYFLTHCNNNFYVVSNLGKVGAEIETADSMSLYKCHYVDWAANHLCRPEHWVKVWPSSKLSTDMHSDPFGVATVAEFVKTAMLMTVEDIDFFKNVAVLYGRKRGMATIR